MPPHDPKLLALVVVLAGLAAPALADEHCNAPRHTWQPREAAQIAAEEMGWQVRRVRTDDNCYEVYAQDMHGNQIEASFDPATLQIRSIEVYFAPGGTLSDLCTSACAMLIESELEEEDH